MAGASGTQLPKDLLQSRNVSVKDTAEGQVTYTHPKWTQGLRASGLVHCSSASCFANRHKGCDGVWVVWWTRLSAQATDCHVLRRVLATGAAYFSTPSSSPSGAPARLSVLGAQQQTVKKQPSAVASNTSGHLQYPYVLKTAQGGQQNFMQQPGSW